MVPLILGNPHITPYPVFDSSPKGKTLSSPRSDALPSEVLCRLPALLFVSWRYRIPQKYLGVS